MTLKQQVTSLELSKRPKELEVKQESYFKWFHITHVANSVSVQRTDYWVVRDGAERPENVFAFTVAELGEMLPVWKITDRR